MPVDGSVQELRRSIRLDLEAGARSGAPPLGHLTGIHRVPTDSGSFALAFDTERPAMAGGAGILEVAMLADLALGGAIRTRIGAAVPMPTISMTLQLLPGRLSQASWADADCAARPERTTHARARLRTTAGDVVGDAQGVFSLPPLPYDAPAASMPWETWPEPESTLGEGERGEVRWPEAEVLDDVTAHARAAPTRAWGTSHVEQRTTSTGGCFEMSPSAIMTNRAGHVQGGALLCTAVTAAAGKGGFPPESFVTATIDFLESTTLDTPVTTRPAVLRSTRRSLFCGVVLEQDRRPRCQISTVFRR